MRDVAATMSWRGVWCGKSATKLTLRRSQYDLSDQPSVFFLSPLPFWFLESPSSSAFLTSPTCCFSALQSVLNPQERAYEQFWPVRHIAPTHVTLLKTFPAFRSLEPDEIGRVKKSWVIVQEKDYRFIEILHQEMICDIKMYELYFNPAKRTDICVEELAEFKNHPRNVYNVIDCIVGDLENENVIIDKMMEVGKKHGRWGVSRKHLSFMTSTIYQAVEYTVGPCMFDRLVDQSWEKFLTNFNDVVGVTAMKNSCR